MCLRDLLTSCAKIVWLAWENLLFWTMTIQLPQAAGRLFWVWDSRNCGRTPLTLFKICGHHSLRDRTCSSLSGSKISQGCSVYDAIWWFNSIHKDSWKPEFPEPSCWLYNSLHLWIMLCYPSGWMQCVKWVWNSLQKYGFVWSHGTFMWFIITLPLLEISPSMT